MTLAEQNQPITRSALLKSFERDDAESYAAFAMDALRQMTSRGVLVPYGDGDTYVYNVLGSAVGQPAETAQVHVLRPQTAPPIINSVGG